MLVKLIKATDRPLSIIPSSPLLMPLPEYSQPELQWDKTNTLDLHTYYRKRQVMRAYVKRTLKSQDYLVKKS